MAMNVSFTISVKHSIETVVGKVNYIPAGPEKEAL